MAVAPLVSARAMPDCDVLDRTKTGENWAMLAERDHSRAEYCVHFSRWRKRWGLCTACKRQYRDT